MKLFSLALLPLAAHAAKFLSVNEKIEGVEVIQGAYIIKTKSAKSVATLAAEHNASQVYDALPGFPGFAAELNDEQLAALLKSDAIEWVEPDQVAKTVQQHEDKLIIKIFVFCKPQLHGPAAPQPCHTGRRSARPRL